MTYDDASQTAAVVCTSSTLSQYSLTFLRWYISYALKDTFLPPVLTCVFPCLTISRFFLPFDHVDPVWLCCFRCECCFDSKQHRLHPRPPCLILTCTTCAVLCSNNSQVFASWKKLAMKFEQPQISTSQHKPSQVGTQTNVHKLKICNDLRSLRLIRASERVDYFWRTVLVFLSSLQMWCSFSFF